MEKVIKICEELKEIRNAILSNDFKSTVVDNIEEHCKYGNNTEFAMDSYKEVREQLYNYLEEFYSYDDDMIDRFIEENNIVGDGSLIFDYRDKESKRLYKEAIESYEKVLEFGKDFKEKDKLQYLYIESVKEFRFMFLSKGDSGWDYYIDKNNYVYAIAVEEGKHSSCFGSLEYYNKRRNGEVR